MKGFILVLTLTVSCFFISPAQLNDTLEIDYFGQSPAGKKTSVFAPDFISREDWIVLNSCFSPDGKEFAFNIFNNTYSHAYTMYTRYSEGKWSDPDTLFDNYRVKNFSYDGNSLYLISPRGMNGPTADIMVSTRRNGIWSEPVKFDYPINSDNGDEFEICESADGTLYFSSNRPEGYGDVDVYKADLVNGNYTEAENLGAQINTGSKDECPYISADESFIIFNSWKPNPKFGTNNLYISIKKNDGTWGTPQDLGETVNTNERDVYPYITPDGKYFLYTIYTYGDYPYGRIYWVSAGFIDSVKYSIETMQALPTNN